MKLKRFMDEAYGGRTSTKKLQTRQGQMIFSLEDLADRVGTRPSRPEVEALVPGDNGLLAQLIEAKPDRKHEMLWGFLGSILVERSPAPLRLAPWNFVGLELCRGTIVLEAAGDHVGEGMKGGRILVAGAAGDCLGQDMSGGGIIAGSCRDYAFRNMSGGFGVVRHDAGNHIGVGNNGGRIVVQGSCGARAGWLMRKGSLRVKGDAGEYLGILMSGGSIRVRGQAAKRAGWRMRGGVIRASHFGPEASDGVLGLD